MGQFSVDALIGGGLPLVIALINQAQWSPKLKAVMALLVCGVAATVAAWIRGELDWTDWRNTFIVIAGAALATYRWIWQPSTIAPTVEAVTSVTPPTRIIEHDHE